MRTISVRGARQHNLDNISLDIPREKLVVITGPSGSGKTSLALDTIFAEGQRRFVESLSTYARQFMAQMPKPHVDSIDGLSPAIAIDQKSGVRNPRSTVGTVTEIADYLRLLYGHVGHPHCPSCGKAVEAQTVQQMVDEIMRSPEGRRFSVLAPLIRQGRGVSRSLDALRRDGFVRIRLDGEVLDLEDKIHVNPRKKHDVDVFIDRIVVKEKYRLRLTDSLETALELGEGRASIVFTDGEELNLSERLACADCGLSLPALEPRLFSFNNPIGACSKCDGLGWVMVFEEELLLDEDTRSIRGGVIKPWSKKGSAQKKALEVLSAAGVDIDAPWKELDNAEQELALRGGEIDGAEVEGAIPWLERRKHDLERRQAEGGKGTNEAFDRAGQELEGYAERRVCPSCAGARLCAAARAVTVGGWAFTELNALSIGEAREAIENLRLEPSEIALVEGVHQEISSRLGFLIDVGLHYLSLDRSASTLAGGEAQRLRLATQIGSSLVGVLYVLDEPSVGLHQRDNQRLLRTLRRLTARGNTVLVVEHDRDTIEAADWIVDMGPGAGALGGKVVAEGAPNQIAASRTSVTGGYLAGRLSVPLPSSRRSTGKGSLLLRGARGHNLKDVDARFPLGVLLCVTGVSGAGKSTLVFDTLIPELERRLQGSRRHPEAFDTLEGVELIDKVIAIDQAPLGRTPRSNPATYTGLMKTIRELFAALPEARARGYGASRFSFNVKGGRCEACQGDGTRRVEMSFLPDVFVQCEQCGGLRYNRETLEIRLKGQNIADVLSMSVDEGASFFENVPTARRKLETLQSVGLGYVGLGQSATTLSGGEAQRIKLARELSRRTTERTLYVFDEPTTGLHFDDVRRLLEVLGRLVDNGSSVLVVEHNLDVIKCADWIIDMGPEGGNEGGRIIAEGPPGKIAASEKSHTGRFLSRLLSE